MPGRSGVLYHTLDGPANLLDDAVVRNGLTDHVVDVLTAASPSGAAGRRSGGRSESDRMWGLP